MNFSQLLQVMAITALVTLILVLSILHLKTLIQGWLKQRLAPRRLKALGVRRRGESRHE